MTAVIVERNPRTGTVTLETSQRILKAVYPNYPDIAVCNAVQLVEAR